MKTIVVDHLKAGKPRVYGILHKTVIQDYETSQGIVREKTRDGRYPEYKLRSTRETVRVEFI